MQEVNEWKIFDKSEYEEIKDFDFKNYSKVGYVYILEYGKYLKIGTTKEPYNRIKTITALGRDYASIETGRVAISPMHTNRKSNESILHNLFQNERVGNGELFFISLENALKRINETPLKYLAEKETSKYKGIDVADYFIRGDQYALLKRKTKEPLKEPLYVSWDEEFEDNLNILSFITGEKRENLCKKIFSYIENLSDFKECKDMCEKETGDIYSTFDVISSFSNLGRKINDYVYEMIKTEEKNF